MCAVRRAFPNTYVIIAAVLLLCAASTCIVPGASPQTWQVFTTYPGGTGAASDVADVVVK